MMTTRLMRQVLLAFFMTALAFLSGCGSSSRTAAPSKYNLVFMAHPHINNTAPLKVRVFLLKSDADFMSADFFSLQSNPQAILGSNLLNSDQFFLIPGQQNKTLTGQGIGDARFIGVMAEYQSLDGKKWRVSLPLPVANEEHFYTFWKSSSDTLEAHLFLDINGIRVVNK